MRDDRDSTLASRSITPELFRIIHLVKLVASIFMEIPHQATRRYTSLRESVGRDIFAKGQKLEPYYVSAFSAYKLDVTFVPGRSTPS